MFTPSSQGPTPAHIATITRLQDENRRLRSYIAWEDRLFANPHLGANHKLELRATRRAVQRGQTHDEQGRTRINLTTIAEQIGVSPDTVSRGLKYLESLGVVERELKPEIQENGERWTRVYARLNDEKIAAPETIIPDTPRNHGGPRYACPRCGNTDIIIRRRVTLLCSCGHESLISETDSRQHIDTGTDTGPHDTDEQDSNVSDASAATAIGQQDACRESERIIPDTSAAAAATDQQDAFTTSEGADGTCVISDEPGRNVRPDLKPGNPPMPCSASDSTSGVDHPAASEPESKMRVGQILHEVAALLLALAGPGDEHIEMSRTGDKKYYTVFRPLTERDLLDHLCGGKARGALCHYPNGHTRGLGWDEDTAEGWTTLLDAARSLAASGYLPILEPSPAGRGGHLWLIFDALVDTSAARRQVDAIAPALAPVREYWPGPLDATRWNKVRLPGGKYVRPGIRAWCQLVSVSDGETSQDGLSAARLLLTHQTPATLVPPPECEAEVQASESKPSPEVMSPHDEQDAPCSDEQGSTLPADPAPASILRPGDPRPAQSIDSQWQTRYGQTEERQRLWFAFTPQYLASWFNAQHDVLDLLPPERSGYGLATWRGEHTASVALRGDQWTDFGASARRPDGTQDGGDALELQARLTQASKSDILRQTAKDLVAQARAELESVARAGQPLPTWLEEIITDAGRAHYERVKCHGQPASNSPLDKHPPAQILPHMPAGSGGLAGYSSLPESDPDGKMLTSQDEEPQPGAVPASSVAAQPGKETFEALATGIGAEIGGPCERCGCTLCYRNSRGDEMCHWCYPRPAKYAPGRLTDGQWERLRRLVKRSRM